MPSVIIVDDEGGARKGMRRLLEAHADIEILCEASTIADARNLLRICKPDIALLDVEMAGETGFDLVEYLSPETKVIFVTAHVLYGARAFDMEAVDYVLKPVRPERLARALERAKLAGGKDAYDMADHITLRDNGRSVVVPMKKVAALVADGYCTRFLVSGEKPFLAGTPLGSHEERLPTESFFRIGRSMIVNLRLVESLESSSRDLAILRMEGIEEPIQLKRAAAARLRAAISK